MRECLGALLRVEGRCNNRGRRGELGGAGRNHQLVRGNYKVLVKMGGHVGALASRVGNLAIQKVTRRVFAMIHTQCGTVDRVAAISIWIKWQTFRPRREGVLHFEIAGPDRLPISIAVVKAGPVVLKSVDETPSAVPNRH